MDKAADGTEAATPRKPITFASLEKWWVLGIKCLHCKHNVWLDRWRLAAQFGKNTPILTLESRFRCSRCKRRAGKMIVAKMPR